MKKPLFIKIILLIAILLTIFYSIYIYQFQNIDFINWVNTLTATIISVLLVLLIAIYIFYYQTNSIQEETKNKFIPMIETGLIDIQKSLFNLKNPMTIRFSDGKELNFYLIIFSNIVIEQAIYSNVFNKEQTEFLIRMKEGTDFHNNVIGQFINMNPRFGENPNIYRKSLEFLHNNHKVNMNDLKKIISSANKYFKFNELNNKIKQNHFK